MISKLDERYIRKENGKYFLSMVQEDASNRPRIDVSQFILVGIYTSIFHHLESPLTGILTPPLPFSKLGKFY